MTIKALQKELIKIGTIGRPHGLKGAFFLSSAQAREPWPKHTELWVKIKGELKLVAVQNAYKSAGQTVLLLEIATDRTTIETLVGSELFVPFQNIKKKKGEYIVAELIGLEVRTERGVIGKIIAVHDFGAQPTFEIQRLENNETVLYPFLDELVKKVQLEEGFLEVVYISEFLET